MRAEAPARPASPIKVQRTDGLQFLRSVVLNVRSGKIRDAAAAGANRVLGFRNLHPLLARKSGMSGTFRTQTPCSERTVQKSAGSIRLNGWFDETRCIAENSSPRVQMLSAQAKAEGAKVRKVPLFSSSCWMQRRSQSLLIRSCPCRNPPQPNGAGPKLNKDNDQRGLRFARITTPHQYPPLTPI